MTNKHLHIVSFDIPYPPDYGGAVDVFYKIKSLAAAGCAITLHCFEYGRKHAPELKQYCEEVYYYPRRTGISGMALFKPYIVSSRNDTNLLKRLADKDAPILFEGVHTTAPLHAPALKNRKKIIRIHNVESQYYAQLAAQEHNFLKKTYFKAEAALLKRYEQALYDTQVFLPLSQADYSHFKALYPLATHRFIPPFHPYDAVMSLPGNGKYCLYHGNLSHSENISAALFLLREVCPYTEARWIIAGRKPDADIIEEVQRSNKVLLISNPEADDMTQLIADAHIHVLPTFQRSGMKLKLLSALFGGRHVLVNDAMLHGTGLNNLCETAATGHDFAAQVNRLMQVPFSVQDVENRKKALYHYTNTYNASQIMDVVYGK